MSNKKKPTRKPKDKKEERPMKIIVEFRPPPSGKNPDLTWVYQLALKHAQDAEQRKKGADTNQGEHDLADDAADGTEES